MPLKIPLKIEAGKLKQFNNSDFISPANKTGLVNLVDSATISIDASLGDTFIVTLNGNRILGNPINAVSGQKITFIIKQDNSGNRTLSFDNKYRFGTDLTSITLTTTANKTDYIGVIYNGLDDKFDIVSFMKGY